LKAVGYVRVSTNKEEQELSLENQTEFFTKYITGRGDELIAIYSDKGKSATKMQNRKELQKMLKAAQRGDFKKLYVKDISRLFRNTFDFIVVTRQLAEYGVSLHLVNMGEGKDIDTFTLNLMAMLAENESQKMSERIKFSKKISQEKGIVPNFVFGYERIDKFTLVPHPEESAWIKEVFRLYTEELWGMARIAKFLYEKRVRTKKLINGEPNYNWSQTTIGHLLRNEIYIGKVINGRQSTKNLYTSERFTKPEEEWFVTDRPDFRIVSDEMYNRAQELIKINGERFVKTAYGGDSKAGRRSDKHLFSNLIKCGACGFSFRRTRRLSEDGKNVERVWWICSKRSAYGTARCTDEYIRIEEEWLKRVVEMLINNLLEDKDSFFKTVEEQCGIAVAEYVKSTNGFDLEDVESELQDFKLQRERIKTMAIRGIIELDEAEREILPINNEIERLTFVLNQADKTKELVSETKEGLRKFIEAFNGFEFDDTLDNSRLKQLIQEIRVHGKNELRVYFNLGDTVDSVNFPLSMLYQTDIDTKTKNRTQRFIRPPPGLQSGAIYRSERSSGRKQSAAPSARRDGDTKEV
jgi:DNA invertase Pin-like site-specific DNA recombinase